MTPSLVLLGLTCGVTALSWRLNSRSAFGAIALLHYYFALIFCVRPFLILSGVATFYPSYLFPDPYSSVAQAQQIALLWITVIGVVLLLLSRTENPLSFIFPPDDQIHNVNGSIVLVVLNALSLVLLVWLVSRFGGVSNVISSAKVEKSLAATFALRQIPGTGLFFAIVLFTQILRGREIPSGRKFAWLAFYASSLALNAFVFYLWGTREAVVAMLLAFVVLLGSKRAANGFKQSGFRVACGALAIVFLATLVYVQRLRSIGASEKAVEAVGLVNNVGISLHLIRYDAFSLLVRDWDIEGEARFGYDILLGNLSAVPRVLWKEKPSVMLPGAWFRQRYQPEMINGWPFSEVGEWYISFGLTGVVLGACIAAALFDAIAKRYPIGSCHPFGVCLSMVSALLVVQGGSVLQFLPEYVLNILPCWVIWFVTKKVRFIRVGK